MKYKDEVEESDNEEEQEQQIQQQIKSCPYCGSRSESIYQKEASIPTYVISIAAVFFFQFWSIFIIPIIIQSTQMIAKRCYDCDQIIQKHNLFSIPSLSDQVLNFRFGSCAVILSRKYAYIILTLLIIIFTYRQYAFGLNNIEQNASNLPQNNIITSSWQEYVNNCGKDVYLSNELRAKSNFNKVYLQNIVKWQGVFMSFLNKPPKFMNSNQFYFIKVKMEPSDSAIGSPDLALKVEYLIHQQYQDTLNQITEGDIILFKGKFIIMGDEFNEHVLDLDHIENTDKKKNWKIQNTLMVNMMKKIKMIKMIKRQILLFKNDCFGFSGFIYY
ncbi:hypothetical protein IMG5_168570 [Ichthyophthirius multifiliis]|uniref:LITAF domain-containing protein n=1 Tax=Ichthyophthirius multifiliis TaxID=5932 RepID=G0R154_ICHMU|nr:hypothetical protein IMG5_168570 [Ichthyophthirius multifiliis]EGR28821.1 hypothetical protein IMG5_168570 [Ichthyophthirius multifiliis]|eukprot:XP_004030057.1 hypothetical protein IMG5_168570 [Ichthyophthirius multifiliis]